MVNKTFNLNKNQITKTKHHSKKSAVNFLNITHFLNFTFKKTLRDNAIHYFVVKRSLVLILNIYHRAISSIDYIAVKDEVL